MSGPVIIKAADWVLTEERGEGAPEAIYGVECMTCEARSPLFDNDPQPIAVWAIHHVQEQPEHDLFLARAEKHWRVVRHQHEDEDPPPARKPVVGFMDRAFGPAFVGLMCLLTALSGYLMALN